MLFRSLIQFIVRMFGFKSKYISLDSISTQATLQQEFYGCQHDPSKPIDIFVQKALHGYVQLKAIGINVNDASVKDVILLNLDLSYHTIKTSLLTQMVKLSPKTVHNILTSSVNNIVSANIILSNPSLIKSH